MLMGRRARAVPSCEGILMVQDQRGHGRERECRRWSGTARALPAPAQAQAAQHPAEQSLHPANAKEDYLGYKMNKQKPSTHIYSIPLLPPAPSRHESGLGVHPSPQSGLRRAEPQLEGTVLDISTSTRGCWSCAHSPVVQQDLQGACWLSAGKMVLRHDILMGRAGPPPGQAGSNIPLGPGACSFALVQGVLLVICG